MVGGGDEDEDGAVVMTIIVVEEDGTADGMAEAVVYVFSSSLSY